MPSRCPDGSPKRFRSSCSGLHAGADNVTISRLFRPRSPYGQTMSGLTFDLAAWPQMTMACLVTGGWPSCVGFLVTAEDVTQPAGFVALNTGFHGKGLRAVMVIDALQHPANQVPSGNGAQAVAPRASQSAPVLDLSASPLL